MVKCSKISTRDRRHFSGPPVVRLQSREIFSGLGRVVLGLQKSMAILLTRYSIAGGVERSEEEVV